MAWNDPIAVDTQWWKLDFLNMYVEAINERRRAVQGDSAVLIPLVTAGTNVQSYAWFRTIQLAVIGLSGFILADVSLAGNNFLARTDPALQLPDKLSRLRRRTPRQVPNLAATLDLENNPAVLGQRAYYGVGTTTADALYVVEYDGTSWVKQPWGTTVDLLTSDSAIPDYCTTGPMKYGDYIGPWLFEDLRTLLNEMIYTGVYAKLINAQRKLGSAGESASDHGGSSAAALSAAKTAAEADHAAFVPVTNLAGDGPTEASWIAGYDDAGDVSWSVHLSTAEFEIKLDSPTTTLAREVTFWGIGYDPPEEPDGVTFINETVNYDDFGGLLPRETWTVLESLPASTTLPITCSVKLGNVNTLRAYPAAPTPSDGSVESFPTSSVNGHTLGWGVTDTGLVGGFVVLHWDVAGGFAYTAST